MDSFATWLRNKRVVESEPIRRSSVSPAKFSPGADALRLAKRMCLALAILGATLALAADPPDKTIREIFVPFEDLNVLLEGPNQRVFLTRQEYEELLSKAQLAPAEEKAPRSRILLSAAYEGTIQDGRATILGTIALEVFSDELLAVPLTFGGVTLRTVMLDDKPAPLGRDKDGGPLLFVRGKGRHELKLEMIAPVEATAAQQMLSVQFPVPTATTWRLTVPGNVEVKSGAAVIRRELDAATNTTRFDLLPQHAATQLVMSLNNRTLLEQRVILARSVLIDELTQAYDKLHATVSLVIPHGAVDRFRFALPAGFEVTEVSTPLLSRWAVEKGDGDARVLDVLLREATTETTVLNVVAINHQPNAAAWSLPQLRPLDVASHVAVVGVVAEDRLVPESLTPASLIPIDATTLSAALPASVLAPEPGAPRIRPIAAYFAPQPDFTLEATFRREAARIEATTNLLFVVRDQRLELRGGFSLLPLVEKLFAVDVQVPAGWKVTAVTKTDGTALPFELFPVDGGDTRMQVRLPQGSAAGTPFALFLDAHATPTGWLNEWSQTTTALPVFRVLATARDSGAIAVQSQDDLVVRPDKLSGLTPLDEKEKAAFGWGETATSLAYRFEAQPYAATLAVERQTPRVTARTFSFLRIEPEGLFAHYELLYTVDQARARRLVLKLPAGTPEAIAIRGLDVAVKEFRSELANGERRWIAELAEPRAGTLRLTVDVQQPLANDAQNLALPLVQADGVVFQSATVAVEGNNEYDVTVKTAGRKVDVGELIDAQYQVGKRLLGAFGFADGSGLVQVDIARRPEFGLPSAIVQRAELVTLLSSQGLSQTAARFHLRTKAPFLEIALPASSTLWSATVDQQPAAPQREGDRLLLSLPTGNADVVRDVQLVYETPSASLALVGELSADAPQLLLRDETGTNKAVVPLADLVWHVVLPDGHRVVRSRGSVFTSDLAPAESPAILGGQIMAAPVIALGFVPLSARYRAAASVESRAVTSGMTATGQEGGSESPRARPMRGRAGLPAPTDAAPSANDFNMPLPMAAPQEAAPVPGPQPAPKAMKPEALFEGRATEVEKLADMQNKFADESDDAKAKLEQLQAARAFPALQSKTAIPDHFWALQGVRSLPVELAQRGKKLTFRSLGVAPRFQVTLAHAQRLSFLAIGLAIIVGLVGVLRIDHTTGRKVRFLLTVGMLLLAAPLVIGLMTGAELTDLFAPAFYVVCAFVPLFVLVGCVRWIVRKVTSKHHPAHVGRAPNAATAAALALFLLAPAAQAQQPTVELNHLRDLLNPPPPVKVPADAVVIPYNADDPAGPKNATKVFVPFAEYEKLWNRAFPNKPLNVVKPVASFGMAGTVFSATLAGDDFLVVTGRLAVEVYVDGTHAVPLPVVDGVLSRVVVDGQPGRISVGQDAKAPAQPVLLVTGTGQKQIEFDVRFKLTKSGGWRSVQGKLPAGPATALDLVVPQAMTEVRLTVANRTESFETTADQQKLRWAINAAGELHLQWRPKLAEAQVDQSLTARSTAVLDVQEDAVRLTWSTTLAFRRGLRDLFSFTVPRDFLVERAIGPNVRGWKTTIENDRQRIDVTLLKPATSAETITLLLSKRAAVGEGEMAGFGSPVVTVEGAALHQGLLHVRRSPLLEVRVETTTGLTRAESNDQELSPVLANISDDSPLGIRAFQTYRFAATPFVLRLVAAPYAAKVSAEVQALLKVAERESRYEARLLFNVANRPRFSVQCRLPAGLLLDGVDGPAPLEWTTAPADGGAVLSVVLPSGQQQFALLVRGRLPRIAGETFPAPRLDLLGVESQEGTLVVQADPAYDVRAEELRGCESVLLERTFGWLNAEQRKLARVALALRSGDYAATLRVATRPAQVTATTITNVRVTPFAVEETIYLQFNIQDAGVRGVQFLLPATLRDSRITVPLLRQKTIEPVVDQPTLVRVKLELQDEVTEKLNVLVEHDRPLASADNVSPLPIVENARTEQRFVVLESAGRDEVVVTATEQLTELNRQQSQWMRLVAILGDRITQAYLVRDDATQPKLAFATKQRAAVETAGARIGLAKTLLIVDGHGAYRGLQEYHVDNKTEQFMEIELPESAELWTARVAGEPVKPAAVPGTTGLTRVRVPLIKTATGDLDYLVELKYGGQTFVPQSFGKIRFPLIHTVNIHVEQSQVRLRLPETQRWFDFGGTMTRVRDEGDVWAGYLSYNSKQVEQLLDVVRGSGDVFSKLRASNNLKQIALAARDYHDTYRVIPPRSMSFTRELDNNSLLLQQAEQTIQQQSQATAVEFDTDNRGQLTQSVRDQRLSRSKNIVSNSASNFDVNGVEGKRSGATKEDKPVNDQNFNLRWLRENGLQRQSLEELSKDKELQDTDRLGLGINEAAAGRKAQATTRGDGEIAEQLGRRIANQPADQRNRSMDIDPAKTPARQPGSAGVESRLGKGGVEGQVRRYQERLEQKQVGQTAQTNEAEPFNALFAAPGAPGGMGGVGFAGSAGAQATPASPPVVAIAGLRSLDVELPQRGIEYLFVTPRGEIAIEARAIQADQWQRLLQLGGIVAFLLAIGLVRGVIRRFATPATQPAG